MVRLRGAAVAAVAVAGQFCCCRTDEPCAGAEVDGGATIVGQSCCIQRKNPCGTKCWFGKCDNVRFSEPVGAVKGGLDFDESTCKELTCDAKAAQQKLPKGGLTMDLSAKCQFLDARGHCLVECKSAFAGSARLLRCTGGQFTPVHSSWPTCEPRGGGRHTDTIVLVGGTGTGKSNMANFLLGRPAFQSTSSRESVTIDAQVEEGSWFSHERFGSIRVVDTPGLGDTKGEEASFAQWEKTRKYLMEQVKQTDVVILVESSAQRFTPQNAQILRQLRATFGPGFWANLIVFLTRYDKGAAQMDKHLKADKAWYLEKFLDIEREEMLKSMEEAEVLRHLETFKAVLEAVEFFGADLDPQLAVQFKSDQLFGFFQQNLVGLKLYEFVTIDKQLADQGLNDFLSPEVAGAVSDPVMTDWITAKMHGLYQLDKMRLSIARRSSPLQLNLNTLFGFSVDSEYMGTMKMVLDTVVGSVAEPLVGVLSGLGLDFALADPISVASMVVEVWNEGSGLKGMQDRVFDKFGHQIQAALAGMVKDILHNSQLPLNLTEVGEEVLSGSELKHYMTGEKSYSVLKDELLENVARVVQNKTGKLIESAIEPFNNGPRKFKAGDFLTGDELHTLLVADVGDYGKLHVDLCKNIMTHGKEVLPDVAQQAGAEKTLTYDEFEGLMVGSLNCPKLEYKAKPFVPPPKPTPPPPPRYLNSTCLWMLRSKSSAAAKACDEQCRKEYPFYGFNGTTFACSTFKSKCACEVTKEAMDDWAQHSGVPKRVPTLEPQHVVYATNAHGRRAGTLMTTCSTDCKCPLGYEATGNYDDCLHTGDTPLRRCECAPVQTTQPPRTGAGSYRRGRMSTTNPIDIGYYEPTTTQALKLALMDCPLYEGRMPQENEPCCLDPHGTKACFAGFKCEDSDVCVYDENAALLKAAAAGLGTLFSALLSLLLLL